MSDLPADLAQQLRDGLITRREAENIAKGRRPDGRPKEPRK